MTKFVWTFVVGVLALGGITPARGQGTPQGVLDHLLCYRMRDPLQISSSVDLIAELQPEFTQKGCVLIKPLEFCVPVSKRNVQPPPKRRDIIGQPLQDDYICYFARCATQSLPADKVVVDQFGRRVEKEYRPTKVCVPARKRPLPCGPRGFRMCGGACPNPSDECRPHPADQGCVCAPAPCGGPVDASGTCGGSCPDTNERCLPNAAGWCTCEPPPPPPCGLNPATGTCGGTCPDPLDTCQLNAVNECTCQPPPPTACQCGTVCRDTKGNPGTCTPVVGTALCECIPNSQPCGLDPTSGHCGGACPNSLPCVPGGPNGCQCG